MSRFVGSLAIALSIASSAPAAGGAPLQRPSDPVEMTGILVPTLNGILPAELVAWRYLGGWQQIPIQVDERDLRDLSTIYNEPPQGAVELVYTDPDTFTGPDSDPTLDGGDEIVFMVKDAGDLSPTFDDPPNVIPGSGVEVSIINPTDGGQGYVYLFRQDGTRDPGAGQTFGTYDFFLAADQYPQDYNLQSGPNPEDTNVTTAFYHHHFSDRWIDDRVHVFAGSATGVDILDRHNSQFAPGDCSRTKDTFSTRAATISVLSSVCMQFRESSMTSTTVRTRSG
ncbi:MAG: hypothetical protein ACE5HD_12770 [Acidobacteriota bacterium]